MHTGTLALSRDAVSAQFIGKHYADEQLLALASRIEAAYDFTLPLPELS